MGREPSRSPRRHDNGDRHDQPDIAGGPASVFGWIMWTSGSMFVVGCTAGGVPYGCFEDEPDGDAFGAVAADPFG